MRTFVSISTLIVMLLMVSIAWPCNTTTYQGCSPEEMRAIQQQQFYGRKYQPAQPESANADTYWRDRQYADRVRAEERNHEMELEKMRSQTEVEVAKQEKRSRYYTGYYYGSSSYYRPPYRPPGYHRPPVVKPVPPIGTHPRPVPPIALRPVRHQPELKGHVYSQGSQKRVSRAIK